MAASQGAATSTRDVPLLMWATAGQCTDDLSCSYPRMAWRAADVAAAHLLIAVCKCLIVQHKSACSTCWSTACPHWVGIRPGRDPQVGQAGAPPDSDMPPAFASAGGVLPGPDCAILERCSQVPDWQRIFRVMRKLFKPLSTDVGDKSMTGGHLCALFAHGWQGADSQAVFAPALRLSSLFSTFAGDNHGRTGEGGRAAKTDTAGTAGRALWRCPPCGARSALASDSGRFTWPAFRPRRRSYPPSFAETGGYRRW